MGGGGSTPPSQQKRGGVHTMSHEGGSETHVHTKMVENIHFLPKHIVVIYLHPAQTKKPERLHFYIFVSHKAKAT